MFKDTLKFVGLVVFWCAVGALFFSCYNELDSKACGPNSGRPMFSCGK